MLYLVAPTNRLFISLAACILLGATLLCWASASGQWSEETVANGLSPAYHAQLLVDGQSEPHVVTVHGNGKNLSLEHLKSTENGWTGQTIVKGESITPFDVAFGADNVIHVLYVNGRISESTVTHSIDAGRFWPASGRFDSRELDSAEGSGRYYPVEDFTSPSIAWDGDEPRLSYAAYLPNRDTSVAYTELRGVAKHRWRSWDAWAVDTAVDGDGKDVALIALSSRSHSGRVEYRVNHEGSWKGEVLEERADATKQALEFDRRGRAHLVYTTDAKQLVYLVGGPDQWKRHELFDHWRLESALLRLDDRGRAHFLMVARRSAEDEQLHVLYASPTWTGGYALEELGVYATGEVLLHGLELDGDAHALFAIWEPHWQLLYAHRR